MMRIAYLSDLHLEFTSERNRLTPALKRALAPAAGTDLLVLAGDIAQGADGIAIADAMSDYVGAPAVYVPGNHECYDEDLPSLLKRLAEAAWATDGRVWFLDRQSARFWFGGRPLAVLGCTLWTDYAIGGAPDVAMADAQARMNDHKAIGWNGRPFSPQRALELHRRQRQWLTAQSTALGREAPRPAILIVTHHAPCFAGLGPRAAALAPSYASDLEADIASWGALTWIHGHTHHRHETALGSARILSAPCGYPGETEDFRCGVTEL